MATSIRLFRGAFGHVSVLNVASDFVTHAHAEAHIILWLDGAAGEMTIGGEKVLLGPDVAAGINSFQPHSHALSADGRAGKFLAFYIDPEWFYRRRGVPRGQPVFASATVPIDPWLHRAAVMLYEELSDGEIDELGLLRGRAADRQPGRRSRCDSPAPRPLPPAMTASTSACSRPSN